MPVRFLNLSSMLAHLLVLHSVPSCEGAWQKEVSHITIEGDEVQEILADRRPAADDAAPEASGVTRHLDSPVLRLNPSNFQGNVLQNKSDHTEHWIVYYCVDWWEVCQDLSVPYEKQAAAWQDRLNDGVMQLQVRVASVDCASHKVLCNEMGVDEYPTVVHYEKGVVRHSWTSTQKKDDARRRALAAWFDKALGDVPAASQKSAHDAARAAAQAAKAAEQPLSTLSKDLFLLAAVLAFNCWAFLSGARAKPAAATAVPAPAAPAAIVQPARAEAPPAAQKEDGTTLRQRHTESSGTSGPLRYLPQEWKQEGGNLLI